MKISLIIPTLRVENLLDQCIESFKGQYDELIIVDDKNKSLAEKINIGLRAASGDYLIVSNDDVTANAGKLKDLCACDRVLSPTVNGGVFKTFHAHMWAMPRQVYAEVGGYDESYKGVYYIDSDYWLRLKDAGFIPDICYKVDINHKHPASTIKTLDKQQQNMGDGRSWFINKWGEGRLKEVE